MVNIKGGVCTSKCEDQAQSLNNLLFHLHTCGVKIQECKIVGAVSPGLLWRQMCLGPHFVTCFISHFRCLEFEMVPRVHLLLSRPSNYAIDRTGKEKVFSFF